MPRRFDCSVGGKLDAGETYDGAVLRETAEELGIQAPPLNFLVKYS
jgi:8-oxo-dGTP pyrophosphatase MutT (NUDIX family)